MSQETLQGSLLMNRNRNTGVNRRDLVTFGGLSALGLSLADWFRIRAVAADPSPPRATSCILLWLDGGPSHLETFDLKPEASAEIRGPFQSIETSVPGLQISELLPLTAMQCQHLAILRSLTSPLGEHGLAHHYLLTGYPPSPALHYPSFGSVVSHLRASSLRDSALPAYIAIPESRGAGAGFLGEAHAPFTTGGDPSRSEFRVRDLDAFPGVDEGRLLRRREYLRAFDAAQAAVESREKPADDHFDQAWRLVTSAQAKQAFDLAAEPPELRARYGPRMFGQSCLLARRLVERGVPFVNVTNTGWDTHENLVLQLRDGYSGAKVGVGLIPTFDQGFAALIQDLAERGMLESTLVVAMGEFGRTPKINTRGGRDHWPRVFSAVVAGGGVSGGQVIGSSDRMGESPRDQPVTPADLAATIYTRLGVNPEQELRTADGRPVRVSQNGSPIRQLL